MKKKLIGFLMLLSSSLFSQTTKVENPNFLNQLQGTWVDEEPGVTLWKKKVIEGNQIKHYSARPREGQWNFDLTIPIINCYKETVTERSNYDGKLKTQVTSFAICPGGDYSKDPEDYDILYYGVTNGRKYIYTVYNKPTTKLNNDYSLSKSYYTSRKYYKVVSNYSPWK